MMDSYSNVAGPTKDQAVQELTRYFDSDHGYIEFVRRTSLNNCNMELMENCIRKVISTKSDEEGAFGSYTGWVVFFRRKLIDEIIDEYTRMS
jgi:hypothetical protein